MHWCNDDDGNDAGRMYKDSTYLSSDGQVYTYTNCYVDRQVRSSVIEVSVLYAYVGEQEGTRHPTRHIIKKRKKECTFEKKSM